METDFVDEAGEPVYDFTPDIHVYFVVGVEEGCRWRWAERWPISKMSVLQRRRTTSDV